MFTFVRSISGRTDEQLDNRAMQNEIPSVLSEGSWLWKSKLYEAKYLELVSHLGRTCQHGEATFKSFRFRWFRLLEKNLTRGKKKKLNTQLSGLGCSKGGLRYPPDKSLSSG